MTKIVKDEEKAEEIETDAKRPVSQQNLEGQLSQFTSATLYRILREKNVPNRSKLTKKTQRAKALAPLLTSDDLKELGILPNPQKHANSGGNNPKESTLKFSLLGKRKDDPVLGIDVHKKNLTWAVADPRGVIDEGTVTNDQQGRRSLLQICRRYKVCGAAMESTAEYWYPVYWDLDEGSIPTLVANAAQTKATQGDKTDRFDARRLALAFRDGRLNPSLTCNREQYGLRKNARYLLKQVQMSTAVKNRLHQILDKATDSQAIQKYLKSNRGISILQGLGDCTSQKEVCEVVRDAYSKGKGKTKHEPTLQKYAKDAWNFLQKVQENGDRHRFFLTLGEFLEHETNTMRLERECLKYAKEHPDFLKNLHLLLTVPGIGVRTAVLILAEIVDVRYFSDAGKLARWAGLTPKVIQSGHRKRATGKLNKAGNKYLRRACWIAANGEYMKYGKSQREGHPIGEYIAHLIVDRHKSWKKAVTAGARKLLTLIHHLLENQEEFSFDHCVRKVAKRVKDKQHKSAEQKRRKLRRILEKMPVNEIVTPFLHRLQRSWDRYQTESRELESICSKLRLVSSSGG